MAYRNRKIRFLATLLIFFQLLFVLFGGLGWNAAPASAAVAGDVMIVKYHAGSYGEWVVLANAGEQDVDLSGWQMNDYYTAATANPKWSFPNGTTIRAKSLLIVESKSGSGTEGAAERGVTKINPPEGSTFTLSRGFEKIVLWNKQGQQADEFAMKAPAFAPPFYIPDSLATDEAFERVSLTDTDTAGDWRKVKSAEPIPAWEWAPLTNGMAPSEAPNAEKLVYNNANPSAAIVSGADGAVDAGATVKVYNSAAKEAVLGSTTAKESGAFEISFDNNASLSTVYVTATSPGKSESSVTAVTASSSDTTPPAPTAFEPIDSATGVALDAAVKVLFDELIEAGSELSGITIKDEEGNLVTDLQTTVQGSELTIGHAPFEKDMLYTVTVPSKAVKDAHGNTNDNAVIWSFQTEDTQASTAAVALELPNGSTVKQGDTIEVLAMLDDYTNVYGIQLQLKVDPTRLQLVGTPEPGALWNPHPQAAFIQNVDAAQGVVTFAGMLTGEEEGISGSESVSVARFVFKAIGEPGPAAVEYLQDGVKVAAHPDTVSVVVNPSVSGNAQIVIEPGQSSGIAQVGLTASATEPKAGQPFTVSVDLTDYTNVYGAQIQLKYNPARLQLQDADGETDGVQGKAGTLFDVHEMIEVYNQADNGTVTFASMLRGEAEGVSGIEPASVVELTFIPIGTTLGDTSVELVTEHVKLAGTPSEDPAAWQLPVGITGSPLIVKVISSGGGGGSGICCITGGTGTTSSDLVVTGQGVTIPKTSIRTIKEGSVMNASVEAVQLEEAFKLIADLPADAQRIFLTIDNESNVEWQLPANVLSAAAEASPNAVIFLQAGSLTYELSLRVADFGKLAEEMDVELKDLQLTLTMTMLTETELEQLQPDMNDLSLLSAAEFVVTVEGGGSSRTIDDFNGTMVRRSISLPTGTDSNQLTGVRFDDGEPVFVPTLLQLIDGNVTAVILSPTNSIYGVAHYEKSFEDVEGHWSQADVELLASKLVVQGVTESAFAPDADITRAEFATLLVRSLGLRIEENRSSTFIDVSQGDWFFGAIEAASNAGLIEGYGDGSFKPNSKITREQMALMLSRALKAAGKPVKAASNIMIGFADRDEVSAWAKDAIGQMLESGIISGMSETALKPMQNATRAQATVMLKRFLTFVGYMNEGGGESNEF